MTPQTGVEQGLGYRCPWYHASLLVNESRYLAVGDYGYVPETLGVATCLDGRLRSHHAFNCGVRSFDGECLRERTVPRLSTLVVSGDRTFTNPLEFLPPKCSIFPPLHQLYFIMRSAICMRRSSNQSLRSGSLTVHGYRSMGIHKNNRSVQSYVLPLNASSAETLLHDPVPPKPCCTTTALSNSSVGH